MTNSPQRMQRILIIGLSHAGYDGSILRGFLKYRQVGRNWLLRMMGHEFDRLDHLHGQVAGALANVTTPDHARCLAGLNVPVVDVSGFLDPPMFPGVATDHEAVGRMAAEHFLNRGLRSLVYFAHGERPFERQRWAGFLQSCRAAGIEASRLIDEANRFFPTPDGPPRPAYTHIKRGWLMTAPKPLGVFCATDRGGMQVCDACHALDLAVPEQVAVLGTDNFDVICESCSPPLSSIEPSGEQIGFEAGRLLAKLLDQPETISPPAVTRLPPIGVVTRQSTDITAIEDPIVARGLALLRQLQSHRIRITDVTDQLAVDRRTFERRFKKIVGRTPLTELYRLRLDAARLQLATTDLTIYEIAINCGFTDTIHLDQKFKTSTGLTPSEYRAQHRSDA